MLTIGIKQEFVTILFVTNFKKLKKPHRLTINDTLVAILHLALPHGHGVDLVEQNADGDRLGLPAFFGPVLADEKNAKGAGGNVEPIAQAADGGIGERLSVLRRPAAQAARSVANHRQKKHVPVSKPVIRSRKGVLLGPKPRMVFRRGKHEQWPVRPAVIVQANVDGVARGRHNNGHRQERREEKSNHRWFGVGVVDGGGDGRVPPREARPFCCQLETDSALNREAVKRS